MGVWAVLSSIRAFLRAGYPSGAPPFGYVPLLALLPRRVTDEEIAGIAARLLSRMRHSHDNADVNNAPLNNADVGVEISRVTHEMPSLDEIERVRGRLAALDTRRD